MGRDATRSRTTGCLRLGAGVSGVGERDHRWIATWSESSGRPVHAGLAVDRAESCGGGWQALEARQASVLRDGTRVGDRVCCTVGTLACPTVEPVEYGLPGAKVTGKISPRRACTPPPQYRFHEVAIVTPRTPGAFPHAQRCFDPLPLPLIQLQAHHRGHPMEHTGGSMESPLF